jgi:hypothetical protein
MPVNNVIHDAGDPPAEQLIQDKAGAGRVSLRCYVVRQARTRQATTSMAFQVMTAGRPVMTTILIAEDRSRLWQHVSSARR